MLEFATSASVVMRAEWCNAFGRWRDNARKLAHLKIDILACEIEEFSCNDYRTNAADRPRAQIRNLDVEEFLRDFTPGRDVFDVAIVNPPRNGCDVRALARLGPLSLPRIVMVSCDPGSLARDVKALAGFGYVMKRAVPVDQFPGTPHVETVALLER